MSRPTLFVTGVFYTLLGVGLITATPRHLALVRSTFEAFANSHLTLLVLGLLLLAAGIATLLSFQFYNAHRVRVIAAGLRAGSMAVLELLVVLVYAFLPTGSITAVIIFGYLFTLSLLTLPPPVEPINSAIDAIRERRSATDTTGA